MEIEGIGKKSKAGNPLNLGLILEHITALAETQILSIYHNLTLNWDNGKMDETASRELMRIKFS